MPSIEENNENRLTEEERRLLLQLARDSIRHGVLYGKPLDVDLNKLPPSLRRIRATFVTLEEMGQLRGCIGSLEARRPLAEDVAQNAFAAAFRDPRFPPVTEQEVDKLEIHISVLTPMQEIHFESRQDLLDQIRPGIDGLVLEEGPYRGTFLPAVWQSLPDKRDFLRHLKMKAGLPADYWSDTIRVWRYTTEVIE